jgi:hypothetical protein
VRPDEKVYASIARGKYKNAPQPVSVERLGILNAEIAKLLEIIQPLLVKHGALT